VTPDGLPDALPDETRDGNPMTRTGRFPARIVVAILPITVIVFIVAGGALRVASAASWGHWVWMVGLVLTGLPVAWRTLRGIARGHFATDIVATLAIITAVLLAQPLAGLIVVLMQTGGEALERYAEGRASRAVRELEAQAPRIAHRIEGARVTDLPVDEVQVGDRLLVRPGEMLPCDVRVEEGASLVDASRLTGEPLPVHARVGTSLLSGSLNGDGALVVEATALARDSQYARIVELVRTAEASKAPLQRLADRYAVWFTPLTLAVCAVTWVASGDMTRVLAVLVVATPCPLILATPIAIIGGINRAAARGIVVRTGGALEQLATVRLAVFDKTGTLTIGEPRVARVSPSGTWSPSDLLRLAAAVEQRSGHRLARAVVDAATGAGTNLPAPTDVREDPGSGVTGHVEGHAVAVGSRRYATRAAALDVPESVDTTAGLTAWVAIDGRLAGSIEFADRLRPGARDLVSSLRALGFRHIILLSGDDPRNAVAMADAVGITEAEGNLLPADKVARVAALVRSGSGVLMVGDGTNDAPALAQADVGIALAGHGGGITAEAADIVLLADDLRRVTEAVQLSRRTMRIARQSIWVGLSLSGIAMVAASLGAITPVVGALLQELIDVAVILNALRTSSASELTAETGASRTPSPPVRGIIGASGNP
jgi:heavy metal translocating P-type ATPase